MQAAAAHPPPRTLLFIRFADFLSFSPHAEFSRSERVLPSPIGSPEESGETMSEGDAGRPLKTPVGLFLPVYRLASTQKGTKNVSAY